MFLKRSKTAASTCARHLMVAVCAVGFAAFLHRELIGVLGQRFPFVTFFPAVMLAALYSGAPAGILATLLSAFSVAYRMPPSGHFFLEDSADRFGMLIFTLSCVTMSMVVKALHRAIARAAEAEAQAMVAEQRRLNDARLLESEARYRMLFDNSMDAVFLTVPDGQITAANPAACAMFDRTEEELCRIGRAGVADHEDPRLPGALAKRAENAKIACELTCVRKDGSKFPAEISSVILDDGVHSFVIIRDITDRKIAEATQRKYAQRLIVLEEELRKRISMDLHDQVGQLLVGLSFNLAHIGKHLPTSSGGALRSTLDDSRVLLREVTGTVRALMVDLRPPQLDELGLVEAVASYGKHYRQRTGLSFELIADPDFPRLGSRAEVALFRITQEALNNISKHADATKATVSLTKGTRIELTIADNGKGFDPQETTPHPTGSGWGLTIMRERAELLGGHFYLETTPGQGTSIRIEMASSPAAASVQAEGKPPYHAPQGA